MSRPAVPDASQKGSLNGVLRSPHEYDPELAKYKAISDLIEKSGDLSDVTDTFHGYNEKLKALNAATGYDCSLRLAMYRGYKKSSPDHLRMSRNEIIRLLSQPKVIVHGSDFIRDVIQDPGFFASVFDGAKRMIGIKPSTDDQQRERTRGDRNAGRY